MAKAKTQDSKPEKIKISIGAPAASAGGNSQGKKARDNLWNHPDMDGGFAEEMEHDPGEVVSPVDLSKPENVAETKPEERPESTPEKKHEKTIEPPSEPETKPEPEPEPEPAPEPEPEPSPATEDDQAETAEQKPAQADAIYKNDEDFYSSKLNPDNAKGKSHKAVKQQHPPRKYWNPRFVFILTLFVTTLLAGVVMLAIMEQQQPGSSMLFDYIPLPEFAF